VSYLNVLDIGMTNRYASKYTFTLLSFTNVAAGLTASEQREIQDGAELLLLPGQEL